MRVAIVGTGGVANRHLKVLASLPDVAIVGHLSGDLSRATRQAERWGGQAFVDLDQMCDSVRPEAIWICVTPDRHGPAEMSAIERGIPLFVEKPLSADRATAHTIARRLARGGPIAAVGYKFRALDTLARARSLVRERPPRMVVAQWHDALPPPAWWRYLARGGGQVVEQATHLLDLARVLVGEGQVVSAQGGRWPRPDAPDGDVLDVSAALLRFATSAGPVPGVLSATCLLRGRQAIHLQLICAGRVLTLSERALIIDTGQASEEVLTTVDPFRVEDVAFVEAVRTRDPARVLCAYADALRTHDLACDLRAALEQVA